MGSSQVAAAYVLPLFGGVEQPLQLGEPSQASFSGARMKADVTVSSTVIFCRLAETRMTVRCKRVGRRKSIQPNSDMARSNNRRVKRHPKREAGSWEEGKMQWEGCGHVVKVFVQLTLSNTLLSVLYRRP